MLMLWGLTYLEDPCTTSVRILGIDTTEVYTTSRCSSKKKKSLVHRDAKIKIFTVSLNLRELS